MSVCEGFEASYIYRTASEKAVCHFKVSMIAMKKIKHITFIVLLTYTMQSSAQGSDPKYFNELTPNTTPKIFGPGKISMENEFEFGAVFSNDRTEFYYGVVINGKAETRAMKFENGNWSQPVKILFHEIYSYNDPFLTPDNKKLFFISDRSLTGTGPKKDYDIWYIERQGSRWSEPNNAGKNITRTRMNITFHLPKPVKFISPLINWTLKE